jgi:hypothetical protein
LRVTTPFEQSDAIGRHARSVLSRALGRYATHIEAVDLSMSLAHSNRFPGAPKDTVTRLRITLKASGRLISSGTAGDIFLSMSRAAARAREEVAQHIERLGLESCRTRNNRSR